MISKTIQRLLVTAISSIILAAQTEAAQTEIDRQVAFHYKAAQQALLSGHSQSAAYEFREILRLNPSIAEAYANLGVIAYKASKLTEAEQYFTEALNRKPSLSDAQAFIGLIKLKQGQVTEAKQILLRTFPDLKDSKLRLQVGTDLMALGQQSLDLEPTLDILRSLIRTNPEDPAVLYLAYRTYTDLAARAVSKLSQTAPDSSQLHQVLAQAASSQDDSPGAVAEYRRALAINPRQPGLHFEMGRALLASSQSESVRDEAQQCFEAELALSPTDANSEYELGEVYALRSEFTVALEHYSRALQLQPALVEAHLAIAKTLSSLGRSGEALPHLETAEHLDPQNDLAHYKLAQAYRALGREPDAERELTVFKALRKTKLPSRPISRGTPDIADSDQIRAVTPK